VMFHPEDQLFTTRQTDARLLVFTRPTGRGRVRRVSWDQRQEYDFFVVIPLLKIKFLVGPDPANRICAVSR
jgi:hypothetical protein